MSSFLFSLYISEIRPLSDAGLVKIVFHSVGCLFVLMTVSFVLQKLVSFKGSHLFTVALVFCAIGVLCRKWSPSHCLFYQVQCGQINIEGFNPFGLVLCMVRDMDLFSFFYTLTSSYNSTISLRCFLSSIVLAPLSKIRCS